MTEILLAIASAAFGAFLKWLLPICAEWWRLKKLTKDLLGLWFSEYQGIDEPPDTWVKESIMMSLDFFTGQLRMKNADNSKSYDYTAFGKLQNDIHIIGHWVSIRPGANAHGCFMQTISPQGDKMYGYWVGPDKTFARRYGRWILARNELDISSIKTLAEEMQKPHLTES